MAESEAEFAVVSGNQPLNAQHIRHGFKMKTTDLMAEFVHYPLAQVATVVGLLFKGYNPLEFVLGPYCLTNSGETTGASVVQAGLAELCVRQLEAAPGIGARPKTWHRFSA
ncbi:MAG: hypothetical protein Q7U57_00725 [Methylovulum sp.]|nr:hypothetical protein [Methylovulum sp.]